MAAVSSTYTRQYFFPHPKAQKKFDHHIRKNKFRMLSLNQLQSRFSKEIWALFEKVIASAPVGVAKNRLIYQIILELPRFFSPEAQAELKTKAQSIFTLFEAAQKNAKKECGIVFLKDIGLTNRIVKIEAIIDKFPPHLRLLPFKCIDIHVNQVYEVPTFNTFKIEDEDWSTELHLHFREGDLIIAFSLRKIIPLAALTLRAIAAIGLVFASRLISSGKENS